VDRVKAGRCFRRLHAQVRGGGFVASNWLDATFPALTWIISPPLLACSVSPDRLESEAQRFAVQFTTTHWSVVLSAGLKPSSSESMEALEVLCCAYWYPLYAYVRRRGYGPDEAQDLTQGFFERLLEKNYVGQADQRRGKFRTFLLSALSHFLADEWDKTQRVMRGGRNTFLSFDAIAAEERYRLEPVEPMDPAKLFERRWATTLVDRALSRLEIEFSNRGQGALLHELNRFLLTEQIDETYADVAPRLGMTPAAMKMSVSRLRQRCRELLREQILETVSSPEEAEEEYRQLMAALRS
jgi:DNA-directed RNA polymerase specialized sigma24 family protein